MKPNLNYFLKEQKKTCYGNVKRAQLFGLGSILEITTYDTVNTPRGMDDERIKRKKLLLSLECHLKTTGDKTGRLTRKTSEHVLLTVLWSHHTATDSLHLTSHYMQNILLFVCFVKLGK